MTRNLLCSLLLLVSVTGFSQIHQKSALYFNNGKLRADSTLSIPAEKLEIWWRAEQNILAAIASNLTYPSVASRNGLEGKLVVTFDFTGNEIKNIRTMNINHQHFDEAAIAAVQQSTKIIMQELLFYQRKANAKGTYFVPLDFSLIDITRETQKRGAIPVIETSPLPISERIIDGLKGK